MQEASVKDYVKLHWIVFLWGFTAILGKEISIPAIDVSMYRTAIAAIVLFFFMRFTRKPFDVRFSEVWPLLLTGVIIGVHWFLFFEAARLSTVSVSLAGMATATFWASLFEPLLKKRKISLIEVLLGLVVIAGLYLIFRFQFNHALGLIVAVFSASLAALFSVLNSKFVVKHNQYEITLYEMLGATLGMALIIPFYKPNLLGEQVLFVLPSPRDWGLLAILSVVCTVYAFSVSVELMKRISAFMVNLTINLEPVYGILLALAFYGEKEQMNAGFYYGTLVILTAVLSYPMYKRIRRKRESRALNH
jgi:drug/metabolite transporter (DMT)-like permease